MNPHNNKIIRPSLTGSDWHDPNCFGCGEKNQKGMHADFRFDSETGEVRFSYNLKSFQEGAPGFVHGGILASLVDESQGVLCFHLGHFVMTDQLLTKYHKAVLLTKPIQLRAWLTAVRKRRLYTKATIHSLEGELLVSSTARWYIMNERVYTRMFGHIMNVESISKVLIENKKRGKEIRQRLKGQDHR